MSHDDADLVNWQEFARARAELAAAFARILGYFREDGDKAIGLIEQAFRSRNAAALVSPAHKLKGEAAQFGAHRLSAMAEEIEMVARRCVESHEGPDELIEIVVSLRPCFAETLTLLDREVNPPAPRKAAGFGRRAPGAAIGFGRAG
ncbi:Hpt domain-containing protein [Sphingobium cloacae]|uniref:Hpt domain-containing protein n=1 Tax=Sphingobium cloacae TaxID=120107 RepID=A0A1E1F2R6_9SPHN|nr:Hpt domain-containing protein [Sphingobium cloacae]BAV64817.1 Hpt domain-containing protein [Sphingobium cloacae]